MKSIVNSLSALLGSLKNTVLNSLTGGWFWFVQYLQYLYYLLFGETILIWPPSIASWLVEKIRKRRKKSGPRPELEDLIHPNILKDINTIVDCLKQRKSVLVNGSCKMGKGDISLYLPKFIHDTVIDGKKVKCVYLKVFTQKANRSEDHRLVNTYEKFPGAICLPTISAMAGGFSKQLFAELRGNRSYLHVIIVDEADYGNAVGNNISEVYEAIKAEGIECLFVLPSASNFENNELCKEHFVRMSMTRSENYIGNESHIVAGRVKTISQGAFGTKGSRIGLSESLKRLVDESPSDTVNVVRISQDGAKGFSGKLEKSEAALRKAGYFVFFANESNTDPGKTFRFDGKTLESCLGNYEHANEFFARMQSGERVRFILVLNKVAGRQTKFEFNPIVSLYYHFYKPNSKPALATFAQEIGRLSGYYIPHPSLRMAIPDARAMEAELAFNKDENSQGYRDLMKAMKMRGAERHTLEDCRKKIRIRSGKVGQRFDYEIIQSKHTGEELFAHAARLGFKARTAGVANRATISTVHGDKDAVRALLGNKVRQLGGGKGNDFNAAWVEFNGCFKDKIKLDEQNSLLAYYPILQTATKGNPCYILMAQSLSPEIEPVILVKKTDALKNTNALAFYTQKGVGLTLAS